MELKSNIMGSLPPKFVMFQSYLYGIEIWMSSWNWTAFALFQSYLYGIEIWKFRGISVCPHCFNRTFMELKSVNCNASEIQLCVSIVPLWNWNRCQGWITPAANPGFNRTFMELKYRRSKATVRRFAFQSYLYGIEIVPGCLRFHVALVSIVPLWNWNWPKVCAVTSSALFQSYLYGIEIDKNGHWQTAVNCFNRTFMELKYI